MKNNRNKNCLVKKSISAHAPQVGLEGHIKNCVNMDSVILGIPIGKKLIMGKDFTVTQVEVIIIDEYTEVWLWSYERKRREDFIFTTSYELDIPNTVSKIDKHLIAYKRGLNFTQVEFSLLSRKVDRGLCKT